MTKKDKGNNIFILYFCIVLKKSNRLGWLFNSF